MSQRVLGQESSGLEVVGECLRQVREGARGVLHGRTLQAEGTAQLGARGQGGQCCWKEWAHTQAGGQRDDGSCGNSVDGGSCLTSYGRTFAFVLLREEAAGRFWVEEWYDGLRLSWALAPVLRTDCRRTKRTWPLFYQERGEAAFEWDEKASDSEVTGRQIQVDLLMNREYYERKRGLWYRYLRGEHCCSFTVLQENNRKNSGHIST